MLPIFIFTSATLLLSMPVAHCANTIINSMTMEAGSSNDTDDFSTCTSQITQINNLKTTLECASYCLRQKVACQMMRFDKSKGECKLYPYLSPCLVSKSMYTKQKLYTNATTFRCSEAFRGQQCEISLADINDHYAMDNLKNGNVQARERSGQMTGAVSITPEGKFNNSLHLKGGYVNFGSVEDTCLGKLTEENCDGEEELTVAMMLKVVSLGQANRFYIMTTGGQRMNAKWGLSLQIDRTRKLSVRIQVDGKLYEAKSNTRINLTKWYHVAFSCNDKPYLALYVNGALYAETNEAEEHETGSEKTPDLFFGGRNDNVNDTASRTKCMIDDVVIFRDYMEPDEIRSLAYTPNYLLEPPPQNPVIS